MIKYIPNRVKILVAMAHKGFNQKTLSEKVGLNPSTLSNFFNGRYDISPVSAQKIAKALDSEMNEIFNIQIEDTSKEVERSK